MHVTLKFILKKWNISSTRFGIYNTEITGNIKQLDMWKASFPLRKQVSRISRLRIAVEIGRKRHNARSNNLEGITGRRVADCCGWQSPRETSALIYQRRPLTSNNCTRVSAAFPSPLVPLEIFLAVSPDVAVIHLRTFTSSLCIPAGNSSIIVLGRGGNFWHSSAFFGSREPRPFRDRILFSLLENILNSICRDAYSEECNCTSDNEKLSMI